MERSTAACPDRTSVCEMLKVDEVHPGQLDNEKKFKFTCVNGGRIPGQLDQRPDLNPRIQTHASHVARV
eukprot:2213805-Prymnesium_polylepis.1